MDLLYGIPHSDMGMSSIDDTDPSIMAWYLSPELLIIASLMLEVLYKVNERALLTVLPQQLCPSDAHNGRRRCYLPDFTVFETTLPAQRSHNQWKDGHLQHLWRQMSICSHSEPWWGYSQSKQQTIPNQRHHGACTCLPSMQFCPSLTFDTDLFLWPLTMWWDNYEKRNGSLI